MKAVLLPLLTAEGRLMGPWGRLSPVEIEENVLDRGDRPQLPTRDVPRDIAQLVRSSMTHCL